MSTKIYNAYRIKKSSDILALLNKAREITTESVANNDSLLLSIHLASIELATEEVEKNPQNYLASSMLNNKEDIEIHWIEHCLKNQLRNSGRNVLDVLLNCSIFYDKNYWYIKFFPNVIWQYDVVNKIANELNLEDYHYQNQTDPPENISYKQYEKREKKWDELTKPSGNYSSGFLFVLFDEFCFTKLINKNYYKGLKTNEELYSHLSYKFDVLKNQK